MFIKILYFIVFLTHFSIPLKSQEAEQGVFYEISNLYIERSNRFICESIKVSIAEIKAKKEEELRSEISSETNSLFLILKEDIDL
jgi:hypothetical protein